MKAFGESVKYYRELKKMSQQELADKMGYSGRSAVSKIELGRNDIPLSQVERLAACLGVSPGTLMGWEEVFVDNPEEIITTTERRLLAYFRMLNPKGQILAMQNIKNISDAFKE